MAEAEYVTRVKLILNGGRLRVDPGTVIVLGDEDKGVNIANLLRNGGIEPYRDEAQVAAIRHWWNNGEKQRRASLQRAAAELNKPREARHG
jgi:hypothetical protein